MTRRISVWQPSWFHGVLAAHSSASSRSRTSRTMKPPSCSLVSMNGPSVTWRLAPSIRTVVAACEPSRPSQAISTPAARAASSNACHAAISRAPSSAENSSAPRSSPYSVSNTFTLHLRLIRSSRGRTSRAISTAATRQLYSRRATPRMYGMRGSNRSARKPNRSLRLIDRNHVFVEPQLATRADHAAQLGQRSRLVGHAAEHQAGDGGVHLPVAERERVRGSGLDRDRYRGAARDLGRQLPQRRLRDSRVRSVGGRCPSPSRL